MKIAADHFKEFGNSEDICCPRCGKHVYMKLFKATNGIGPLGISLYDLNVQLFAFCPECGAFYTVDEEITRRAAKSRSNNYSMVNEKNIIYLRDLK